MGAKPGTRRGTWLALALVLVAFGLRAYHLDFQSLWRDEVDALRFATRALPDLLATFRTPGENGPLYFLVLRGWLLLTGRSEFALRSLSLIAGVLAVPLTVALGRRLLDRQTALVGGLLVATSPYLVWYSQEAKMYALTVSLVIAALWAYWASLTRGGWGRWALCWLLTTLAIYVHILSVLLIPVQIVWFAVACILQPRVRRQVGPMLLLLALLTLPYLPIVRWQLKLWLRPAFQTGHAFVPLGTMCTTLLLGLARGVQSTRALWTLVPFVFFLLCGVALDWKRRVEPLGENPDEGCGEGTSVSGTPSAEPAPAIDSARPALIIWTVLPVLSIYLISLHKPLFTDRYLIGIAPAFCLLLATGVTAVWRRWPALSLSLLVLAVSLNMQAIWSQSNTVIKSDFRAAAAYVEKRRGSDELLLFLMPYVRHTYAYYAADPVPRAEAPYTNDGTDVTRVDEEMTRITTAHSAVWLIRSEAETWDRRGLSQSWLDEHGSLTDSADFVRVQVARYALSSP
jgi:4-amino-4-deoxy-L-arabinose transferase-like glycosyltransferase